MVGMPTNELPTAVEELGEVGDSAENKVTIHFDDQMTDGLNTNVLFFILSETRKSVRK